MGQDANTSTLNLSVKIYEKLATGLFVDNEKVNWTRMYSNDDPLHVICCVPVFVRRGEAKNTSALEVRDLQSMSCLKKHLVPDPATLSYVATVGFKQNRFWISV